MNLTADQIDWNGLRRLRDLFLAPEPAGTTAYWESDALLASYDATLGERIAWKWQAVLAELSLRGWQPPMGPVYDFGCGTGIAARSYLKAFPEQTESLTLYDRAEPAMRFAERTLRPQYPQLTLRRGAEDDRLEGVVLISHVLTELATHEVEALLARLPRARAVLWVEPGTKADAGALIRIRERMRDRFSLVAPCPHQGPCGLLEDRHAAHWCHHFAPPPSRVHQDPFWGRFRKELNLDLGPVAYSFLVFDKTPVETTPLSRVIGRPLALPKFARLLSCQQEDVAELVISRRAGSALYQTVKKSHQPSVYCFERRKNRITGGHHLADRTPTPL